MVYMHPLLLLQSAEALATELTVSHISDRSRRRACTVLYGRTTSSAIRITKTISLRRVCVQPKLAAVRSTLAPPITGVLTMPRA